MDERRKIFHLFLIIAVVVLGAGGIAFYSLYSLYKVAFREESELLKAMVVSQSRLMGSVARFDVIYSAEDVEGGAYAATIGQIHDAYQNVSYGQKIVEFVLAIQEGDQIVFLQRHHNRAGEYKKFVPLASRFAEPMRRALAGESGTMIGIDYRGVEVLAAYEPVVELNLGIVAKMDIAVIRAPFINAGLVIGGVNVGLIFLGSLFLLYVGNPLFRHIEENEKRLRMVLDNTVEAIITIDEQGFILAFNKAAEKMFGYTERQMLGTKVNRLMPEPYGWLHDGYLKNYLSTGKQKIIGFSRELEGIKKDGSLFPIELGVSEALLGDSRIFTGIIRNLTEQKQLQNEREKLEAQLWQSQKIETIGALAGGIAHDFNNILTGVSCYADLCFQELPPDSQSASDLTHVIRGVSRATNLVKQILAFSRQDDQEKEVVEIHLIVQEALALLRASLPASIEIEEDIDSQCGLVLADSTQIHQVILNLCTNAEHAITDQEGVIKVTLVEVDADEEFVRDHPKLVIGNYAKLTISDSGEGMDRMVKERIFEPFFTTKPVGQGTGLGLSVVHGITTAHHGALSVDSELGKGTSFYMYLPIVSHETEDERVAAKPMKSGSERIMLVDDEEDIKQVVKRVLTPLGYSFDLYDSSKEALAAFIAQPENFDLLITDQTMPQMTGLQLSAEVRSIRPEFPVIIMTGFSDVVTAENYKRLGLSDLIMKPVDIRELCHSIRKVFDSGSADKT